MTTRQPTILDAINIEHALEFSYIDYHADALDYLCLFRSTGLTIKAYFAPTGSRDDVLCPHNHRYDFDTRVIAGSMVEVQWSRTTAYAADVSLNRYRYDCIADGGVGFEEEGPDYLYQESVTRYVAGDTYNNKAHTNIHTLREIVPGTIILLNQYADVGSRFTYGWGATSPVCTYRKMERADVLRHIEQLHAVLT